MPKPEPLPPGRGYKANSQISRLKQENNPNRYFGGAEGKVQKRDKENANAELNAALSAQVSINPTPPRKG